VKRSFLGVALGSHDGAPYEAAPNAIVASDVARAWCVAGAIHPVRLIFKVGCGQKRQALAALRPELAGLTKQALTYCLRCHLSPVTSACIYRWLHVSCQHNHVSVTCSRRGGPRPARCCHGFLFRPRPRGCRASLGHSWPDRACLTVRSPGHDTEGFGRAVSGATGVPSARMSRRPFLQAFGHLRCGIS
jgi:hypothetical protein